jgi:hypothetical protein
METEKKNSAVAYFGIRTFILFRWLHFLYFPDFRHRISDKSGPELVRNIRDKKLPGGQLVYRRHVTEQVTLSFTQLLKSLRLLYAPPNLTFKQFRMGPTQHISRFSWI